MLKFHYLNEKLSPGFVAIFSGRMLQFIGNGLLGLFVPIFLFIKMDYSIRAVFIYYAFASFIYFALLPIGAVVLNRVGLRAALRLSVFFNIGIFLCYFFIDYNTQLFIILSLIFFTLFRITFWYPYQVDFAKFTDAKNRGKEVSLVWATNSVLSIIMPIIAGVLISRYNFNLVFVIAILFYGATLIPYMTLPRTHEKFSWGILETFKKFIKITNRKIVLSNMANGAESGVALIIWPIFIWDLLSGNFLAVGAISSFIVFISVILQLIAGKYTDKFNKRHMIKWGSSLYALGWVMKIFVITSYQIFLVGAYHSLVKIFKDTPFDALVYDLMADYGHYVDEHTVLREMAVHLGRTLILVFAIFVALSFGLNWTFVLAALASLFINLL